MGCAYRCVARSIKNMNKICRKCDRVRHISLFHRVGRKKDGKPYYATICKLCKRDVNLYYRTTYKELKDYFK